MTAPVTAMTAFLPLLVVNREGFFVAGLGLDAAGGRTRLVADPRSIVAVTVVNARYAEI
ncbi:hypothetical protein Ssi02_33650 [Sinosporangium siamense]|uniref:Uncharacterized protein n=1 Tax=Sinosporangium siamense TaxID=1367973 RepID=A0A919RIS8_9ACTN|nr:hypothetical protein Ssi02_33650 [Sinosporangium siamense]